MSDLSVKVTDNTVLVNMHGTAYTLNNQKDIDSFKADMGWFDNLAELVAKYLDKMQRVLRRVSAAVKIVAADAVRYALGLGALSFWQEQKLRWTN